MCSACSYLFALRNEDRERVDITMALAKLEPSRPDELAAQVKEYRSVLGWSQQELALRAGCSRPTIARLEGGRVILSLTMTKVIDALNAGISDAVQNNQVHGAASKSQPPKKKLIAKKSTEKKRPEKKHISSAVKTKADAVVEPAREPAAETETVPSHKVYGPVFYGPAFSDD